MDETVPVSAVKLLNFIASFEAPKGYDTIFGNHQALISPKLTAMTIDQVLAVQPQWSARFGSSAAGRYQFMRATLQGLKTTMGLDGGERLDARMQDRLAYQLLLRRGFRSFAAGKLSLEVFALNLAKEWASLPVLRPTQGAHRPVARGQSFYAGDPRNRSLVDPERVEAVLREVNAAANQETRPVVKPEDPPPVAESTPVTGAPTMNPDAGAKPWYMSKSVIGGLIAVGLPILSLFFPAARLVSPENATDWAMKLVTVAGPIVGGLLSIYGRVRATQPIRGTEAEAKTETYLGGGNAQVDIAAAIGPALQGILLQIGQAVQQGVADGVKTAAASKTGP